MKIPMEASLDQLIEQLQQVVQQLEILEVVLTVFPCEKQGQSQLAECNASTTPER